MSKHCPAFAQMLLFSPNNIIKTCMLIPLAIITSIIIALNFISVPDESNVYIIYSGIHSEKNNRYSFTYPNDSIWQKKIYYILYKNKSLINIKITEIKRLQPNEYKISFSMTGYPEQYITDLDRIEVLPSRTFLSFFLHY